MAKKYDAVVTLGSYEVNGETKKNYINAGAVMEGSDGGLYLLMPRTFNPAGVPNPDNKDSILISFYEPKAKDLGGM